ncbi:MAG: T9SS type A sorting domain-containing protein [Bacteroidetes bacterium]|nr:T9SS type A sorting domain-containing protein [Bacteroidota bacterium]
MDLHITPHLEDRLAMMEAMVEASQLSSLLIQDQLLATYGNKQAVSWSRNGDHSTQMPKFTLGPNPATELCVNSQQPCSNGQFRILSLSGAVVREFSIPALSQFELDISSFTPGVYMVQDVLHSARAIRLVKL